MAADTVLGVSLHMRDDSNLQGTMRAHLYADSGQTIAAAKTAANAFAAAVAPLSDCEIDRYTIDILSGDTSGTYPITAGAEIQEVGELGFSVAVVPYHWTLPILGFKSSKLTGEQVNTADTDVAALITLLTGAVLGGNYTDRSARALQALAYSFQGERKRRAKLHEVSFKRA